MIAIRILIYAEEPKSPCRWFCGGGIYSGNWRISTELNIQLTIGRLHRGCKCLSSYCRLSSVFCVIASYQNLIIQLASIVYSADAIQIEKYEKKDFRFPYSRENKKSGPENYARIVVSRSCGDEVSLQIGVYRGGTDRMYSNFLFEAGKTQDEIKAWLKNTDASIPVILKCATALSDSVDDDWD